MTTNNLKPCPLCGGTNLEVAKDFYYNNITRLTSDAVECKGCGLFLHIDDWNTRPIEDGLQAEIDRLKTALTEIRDLARTGLAPDAYNFDTEEKWLRYKVNRISGMASRELDKGA